VCQGADNESFNMVVQLQARIILAIDEFNEIFYRIQEYRVPIVPPFTREGPAN